MPKFFLTAIICFVSLLVSVPVFAYVASSSSYRLEKDSINFAGLRSTSSSFIMEDTVGEPGSGLSSSTAYNLSAGYQTMDSAAVSVTIALNSPSNVAMSPSINGASGGESTGSVAWTVTTNNPTGYSLSVTAGTNPAFTSGANSFTDYTSTGSDPDFTFSVAAADAEFGFSPEGSHITSTYKDNGSACATGSSDTTDSCWTGFNTSGKTVASSGSANNPTGTATTLKLKAKVGTSKNLPAGTYSATITATAVTL